MQILNEVVSLTLSYSDGLVRHIPDVSAFLVRHKIPLKHPAKYLRPSSIFITGPLSKECIEYLNIRLNKHALNPHDCKAVTYADN
jgi:hypothetical protein